MRAATCPILRRPLLLLLLSAACRCSIALASPPPFPAPVRAGEFSQRRAQVIEELERAGGSRAFLLLRAPPEDHFAGDVTYPYRPDNDLVYLTGIDEPGCALLLSAGEMKGVGREALFITASDPHASVWMNARSTREQASERSGIPLAAVLDVKELKQRLAGQAGRGIYFGSASEKPTPFFHDTGGGFEPGKPPSEAYGFLLDALGSGAFHLDLRSATGVLRGFRQVKSPAEVALLEKAIDATAKAQIRAWRSMKPGTYEYELRAVIEATFLKEGCPGWSFPPIIGSGPNSCVLHYDRYDRKLEDGDVVVLDIGAEYSCYAADVTRTVPVGGKYSERQRAVYEAVLAAQEAAIRVIQPGARFASVHETAFREVGAGLKRLGLIRDEKETGRYFLHGTSHGLGLDVHDGLVAETLTPGMVITVEPGIYIPEERLGIRIEDDVLVTETGYRVLSGGLPKTVEAIEAIFSAREL